MEPSLKAKGLKVQLLVDEALPDAVYLDQHKMQQVLANVLSNAVKFTHQGSITIEATRSGLPDNPRLLVAVKTRIGITPKTCRGFCPLTQGDSSTTRQYREPVWACISAKTAQFNAGLHSDQPARIRYYHLHRGAVAGALAYC